MILCKNSKCPHTLRLNCKRYLTLLKLAGTGKLINHEIETFELEKDKCENFIKLKR